MVEKDLLWFLNGIDCNVKSVKFSPSGEFLAGVYESPGGSGYSVIFLFNPITGAHLKTIKTPSNGIAFFPSSKYLCSVEQSKLIIWDLITWKKFKKLNHKSNRKFVYGITSFAITPNEKYIISGAEDIHIWDFPSGNKIHTLKGFGREIGCYIISLAISPDSKFLIASPHSESGAKDKDIKIWDIKTGELIKHFQNVGYSVGGIHFFPDGKKYIFHVVYDVDSITEIREFSSNKLLRTLTFTKDSDDLNTKLMTFSPDGKFIIYAGEHKKGEKFGRGVRIRKIETEELIASYYVDDMDKYLFSSLDISRDGNLIALSGWTESSPYERRCLSVWDFSKRKAEFEKEKQVIQEKMRARIKYEKEQKEFLLNEFENQSRTIEALIQESNYSKAIELLSKYRKQAKGYDLYEIMNWSDEKLKACKVQVIKKTVLNLCTKYARLQIIEIAEECGVNNQLIISTVKAMIKNQEIYAKYFESSKSVAFDQQANIEEIDNLMTAYKKWEDKEFGKK